MRIAFIRPNINDQRSHDAIHPLTFAVLAGVTPPDVELVLFDERIEPIPENLDVDLVAITIDTFRARRSYQIAVHFHRQGIPVIVGGCHPTFLPEESLQYSDSVVVGEAEHIWPRIVEHAKMNKLERLYQQSHFSSLQGLQYSRSLFYDKPYKKILPVQFGRGCGFACEFCSVAAFFGRQVRYRPVSEILAEIEQLESDILLIVDDNILADVGQAKEFFSQLRPLKVRWGCEMSLRVTQDHELMDLMAKSGCIAALVGFESLEKRNLYQMGKRANVLDSDYLTAVRKLRDRGIMVYGSFIFGYDHDTPDIFDQTLEFALEAKLFLVNFTALTPYPGTRLYKRLQTEGRLIYDRWWLSPDYRYGEATYKPSQMTPEQLAEGCVRVRREFYRYSSIFTRALDRSANARDLKHLGVYLGVNLLSRRELDQKLNQRLGADEPLEPIPFEARNVL